MPTNAIGSGTRNVPVNGPVDWWARLGQVAGPGMLGALVREKVEAGLALTHPQLAAELRAIRDQYYGAVRDTVRAIATERVPRMAAVLLAVLFLQLLLASAEELRSLRCPKTARLAQRAGSQGRSRGGRSWLVGDGDGLELDEFTGGLNG